jgi:plastocyanin
VSGGTRILAGLLGLAVGSVLLPAVAVSETTPTIEAVNSSGYYGEQHHSWSPSVATVGAGGAVTFADNSSEVEHGLEWTGPSGQPTPTCTGVPVDSSGTNWRGQCTFSQPGTYTFRCTVHPTEMTGTITVRTSGRHSRRPSR